MSGESAEDRMLGCRYELKYLVSVHAADAIEQQLSSWLIPDEYSSKSASGYYSIASAYLDSRDLQLYKETCDGKSSRYKLRIRTYNDEPQTPCFFEIKRRLNTVIVKSRVRISKQNATLMLDSLMPPDGVLKSGDEAFRQFQFYKTALDAAPVVHILYERKAYETPGPNPVRITFDRNVRCFRSGDAVPVIGGTPWLDVLEGRRVFEVKFTGRYPGWVLNLVRMFGLRAQSVSKYAHAVVRAGLAAEQPVLRRAYAAVS